MCGRQYKKLMIGIVIALFVFAANLSFAEAEKAQFLRVSLTGYLVVPTLDDKGDARENLCDLPESILPGGIIQYEIMAYNSSTGSVATDVLKNVALFGAIPQGTAYIENTASDASLAAFSIDGGKSYSSWPVIYKAKLADGSEVLKTAEAELCTGIRWTLPMLKPQESIKIVYRVKVVGR